MMEAGHHGARADVDGTGDFFVGKAFDLAQCEHGAKLGGKGGERTLKSTEALVAEEPFAWIGFHGDGLGRGLRDGFVDLGAERDEAVEPAPTPPEMVDGAAHRDRVQPGGELRLAAEAVEFPPRDHPHVLGDLPGVGLVAHHRKNQAEDRGVVRPHEVAEGRLIARLRAAHEPGLVGRVVVGGGTVHAGFAPHLSDRAEGCEGWPW